MLRRDAMPLKSTQPEPKTSQCTLAMHVVLMFQREALPLEVYTPHRPPTPDKPDARSGGAEAACMLATQTQVQQNVQLEALRSMHVRMASGWPVSHMDGE
jgi:hypothetical protein